MRKLPSYCGECWFTNQQQFEKEAAGLLIDNTRFVEKHGHGAPDLSDRETNQYWIFWPREAASKNIANFGKYTSGKRLLDRSDKLPLTIYVKGITGNVRYIMCPCR